MSINLTWIEARLQSFIEGNLSLSFLNIHKGQVVPLLLTAIQKEIVQDLSGELVAPSQWIIYTHPEATASWQATLPALDKLALFLQDACQQAGIYFLQPPSLRLQVDPTFAENQIQITASFPPLEALSETSAVVPQLSTNHSETNDAPPSAFLILDGTQLFPLERKVVNLGRRADNQIIFQDPRVSRQHAQLRFVRNQYILFDLNSSGGTYVNDQRISQVILKPGDVISLAGVILIYGEESHPSEDTSSGKTQTADLNKKTT